MNLPSPVIAAHPPSRRARWHGVLALCGSPPASSTISCAAPLARALILNGNTEAGAAKLAAYAFIAGGIQSFLMRLSPRLGFMALLCSTLTLLGVLVAWNLLPRIADGLPYAGAALGWLALAGLTYAGWRRGAHRADLGRAGATASLAISVLALLLAVWCWCCARWFSESRTARRAGGPPTTRNTDPDEIRRCILALRGRLSRRPA